MNKDQLLRKMYYIRLYLKAAIDSVEMAKRNMKNSITINGNCFEEYKFLNSVSKIEEEIYEIDNKINPRINNM